jgi:spermidine/putrescine transport system permease protein
MSAITGGVLDKVVSSKETSNPKPTTKLRALRRRGWLLPLWGWLVIVWLSSPIVVMIVFGFNDGNGRATSVKWNGFTLKWYRNLFAYSDLTTALVNSITIALLCTVISVVLGTLMGVALGRWKFRGVASVNLLLFANIAAPEVVLGAALLSLFLTLNIPRGYVTILLAHVMFSLAYVVVTVRATHDVLPGHAPAHRARSAGWRPARLRDVDR